MTLPPWLNVAPEQFLAAAESGNRLREQIEARNQQAALEGQRIAQSGARISDAQQRHDQEQALREWQTEQRIKMAQDALAQRESESAGRGDLNQQRLALAQAGLDQREKSSAALADYRKQLLASRAAAKPQLQTISETQKMPGQDEVPAIPPIPAHREGGIPLLHWLGHDVPEKPGSPAIPAIPARTITKTTKIPVSGDSAPEILPFPKSKADLKKDGLYQTPRGVARWDGKVFTPIESSTATTPDQPQDQPQDQSGETPSWGE